MMESIISEHGETERPNRETLFGSLGEEGIQSVLRMIGGPDLVVLDAPTGDARIGELICDQGNAVFALDLPEVVEEIPYERKEKLFTFVGEVDKKLPFDNEFFDAVFGGGVLEHLVDLKPFMREVWRVLKPDGRLVLVVRNTVSPINRIAMLFAEIGEWHRWENFDNRVRYFTPQTMQEALFKYGFITEELDSGRNQREEETDWLNCSWVNRLSSQEKEVLISIIHRYHPDPIWRGPYIILVARKIVRKPVETGSLCR